ncbi:MAG: hypothetical protein ACI8QZ_002632 [Chlamydiales bacterium]
MSRRQTCLALWIVFGAIFAASLPDRLAHLDDAWLGEQAYLLARDGVVRSDLFHGFLGYEDRIWVFHKLFIPQGALAIDLFGWSSAAIKSVSLPWFLITLLLLHLAVRRDRHIDRRFAPWVPLFFFAHPLAMDYAYTFRPEICLTALGLGSYLALRAYVQDSSRAALAAGAILAGVGVLMHLNGVIFVAAGAVLLAMERRWWAASGFLILAASVSALYVADAAIAGELPALWAQFARDPALEVRDFHITGLLSKLLEEPRRWMRHGEDVATSLLVLVGLVSAGLGLRRQHRSLAIYTLVAFLVLGLTAQSKTPKYALPLLPFLLLLVAAGMQRSLVSSRATRARRRVVLAVASIFLVTCASRSWRYFSRNTDEAARHVQLLAGIERGTVVAADLTFVFDEIEHHRLRGLWAYRVAAEGRGEVLDLRGLIDAAREDGALHIILDLKRELPRRLAEQWPELAGGVPASLGRSEPGNVMILDVQGKL